MGGDWWVVYPEHFFFPPQLLTLIWKFVSRNDAIFKKTDKRRNGEAKKKEAIKQSCNRRCLSMVRTDRLRCLSMVRTERLRCLPAIRTDERPDKLTDQRNNGDENNKKKAINQSYEANDRIRHILTDD